MSVVLITSITVITVITQEREDLHGDHRVHGVGKGISKSGSLSLWVRLQSNSMPSQHSAMRDFTQRAQRTQAALCGCVPKAERFTRTACKRSLNHAWQADAYVRADRLPPLILGRLN